MRFFVTLANGGTVVLVAMLWDWWRSRKRQTVTLVNTVPSAMEELGAAGRHSGHVQTINLAGEALSAKLVDAIYESSAVKKVYDLYGPSEDTTYSTYILRKQQGVRSHRHGRSRTRKSTFSISTSIRSRSECRASCTSRERDWRVGI